MGSQINPCVVVSFSESCHNTIALVCKGYKLGVMWLGAPFPSQSSAGPHHLLIQEGHLSQLHLWFFPCSHAFLIHASTSCLINAALILPLASLQLLKHSCSSWEMYTGWNAGCLGAHVLRGGRTQLGALLGHSFTPGLMEPGHDLSTTLSWAQFNSPPLLGGSGHMWSRQVSCLLFLRHQWSFSCATTASSLTKAPHEICRWGVWAALCRLLHIWLFPTPPSEHAICVSTSSSAEIWGIQGGFAAVLCVCTCVCVCSLTFTEKRGGSNRFQLLIYQHFFQFERFLQWRGPSFICGFSKSVFCSCNWQAAAHLRALQACQQHWGWVWFGALHSVGCKAYKGCVTTISNVLKRFFGSENGMLKNTNVT